MFSYKIVNHEVFLNSVPESTAISVCENNVTKTMVSHKLPSQDAFENLANKIDFISNLKVWKWNMVDFKDFLDLKVT